jgi:hypothetical protein
MELNKKWNKSKISGKILLFPICPKQKNQFIPQQLHVLE